MEEEKLSKAIYQKRTVKKKKNSNKGGR